MKKRKGRSPSLDIAGKRREILKNLRFSEKEWELVKKRMAESKIAEFSEYARLACLQVSPIILDAEGLHLLAEIQQNLEDFGEFVGRQKC